MDYPETKGKLRYKHSGKTKQENKGSNKKPTTSVVFTKLCIWMLFSLLSQ
jgi:hypothetical protein